MLLAIATLHFRHPTLKDIGPIRRGHTGIRYSGFMANSTPLQLHVSIPTPKVFAEPAQNRRARLGLACSSCGPYFRELVLCVPTRARRGWSRFGYILVGFGFGYVWLYFLWAVR